MCGIPHSSLKIVTSSSSSEVFSISFFLTSSSIFQTPPPGKRNLPNGGIIPKGIDNATKSIIVIKMTTENFMIVFRVIFSIENHIFRCIIIRIKRINLKASIKNICLQIYKKRKRRFFIYMHQQLHQVFLQIQSHIA